MMEEVMTSIDEDARILQNEYIRNWRNKNKDKVRQYNRNYWLKKAKQARQEQNKGKGE